MCINELIVDPLEFLNCDAAVHALHDDTKVIMDFNDAMLAQFKTLQFLEYAR